MAKIADQTLDKITLFTLNCSLFHGNRKLSAADLKSALGVTIDVDTTKQVMALGVKRVFDKTELAKLGGIKSAMLRACAAVGTPFLGGFAVPDSKSSDLASDLDRLMAKGIGLKADLMACYQTVLDKFALANPIWASIIKTNAFDQSYVEQQIQFDWNAVRVAATDDGGIMSRGLTTKVGGLLGGLLADISKAATQLAEDSLEGKNGVTRRAFRPLIKMADKLDGFTFIDTRVGCLAEMIRHVLGQMPDDCRIEGADLRNLVGLTAILANPERALILGQQISNESVEDAFDAVFGAPYKVGLPIVVELPSSIKAELTEGLDSPVNQSASLVSAAIEAAPSDDGTPEATYAGIAYEAPLQANVFGL